MVVLFCFFFFFFQAEDGIRDWSVTGVQTCALPISWARRRALGMPTASRARAAAPRAAWRGRCWCRRSEERRVGKEWRSRRSPEHARKKKKRKKVETM